MGFRISWLAVEGTAKEEVLASLSLADTGEMDGANEAPFSIAELTSGWAVLWANDPCYASEVVAADLSRKLAPTIMVQINETCMHSTAMMFVDGLRRWRLHHEGDQEVNVDEREGKLPTNADEIEAVLRRRQAQADVEGVPVDYLFDNPLEVARSTCGFKHDECGEWSFTIVRSLEEAGRSEPKKSLFGRLFGSR